MKRYKDLLSEFVKFKTISSTKSSKGEILDCINWLQELFKQNCFSACVYNTNESNPIIFAEYKLSSKAKTILVYGHYDVQPADLNDGWYEDPIKLIEKDNTLYARGIADNKGQILLHLHTVFELIEAKKLKYNVKFLIEGNEETGSKELPEFIKSNKELLKADFVLISDGELSNNAPTIEIGFRGNANFTLKLKSANSSVHSGMYGNSIPNAIVEITNLAKSFYDANNQPKIEGLYSGIEKLNSNYKDMITPDEESIPDIKRNFDIKKVYSKNDFEFQFQNGLLPSLIITGIDGGHYQEGYANIVPNASEIKVNVRFAPYQSSKEILQKIEAHINKNISPYVKYDIEYSSITEGTLLDINNDYFKIIKLILEKVYKKKSVYKFVGGSLPIINSFVKELKVPLLSIPLANSNCNMHGVNENYKLTSLNLAKEFCDMLYTC